MPTIINFLPDGFHEREKTKHVGFVGGVVLAVATACVVCVFGVNRLRLMSISSAQEQVEAQCKEAAKQIDELKQLQLRERDMLRKIAVTSSILERVPRSYLLAQITNALPDLTSLTLVRMKTTIKRKSASSRNKAKRNSKARGAKTGKEVKKAEEKQRQIIFTVSGLAPTDVEVASFMSRLSACPLFGNVDLVRSEKSDYSKEVRLRQFTLEFELVTDTIEKVSNGKQTRHGVLPRPLRGVGANKGI